MNLNPKALLAFTLGPIIPLSYMYFTRRDGRLKINEIVDAIKNKRFLNVEQIGAVYGRVITGKPDHTFEKLHYEKDFVFIMGPDGISMMTDPSLGDREKLRRLGMADFWVNKAVERGYVFKFGVWEGGSSRVYPATWHGLFDLIGTVYPKSLPKVRTFETDLRQRDFESIEKECPLEGFTYAYFNKKKNHSSPYYIDHLRFPRLESPELWQVRGWLYFCFGVKELFSGDGYTVGADGRKYVKEYLVRNFKVSRHHNFRWINLNLNSSTTLEDSLH